MKKIFKSIAFCIIIIAALGLLSAIGINMYVCLSSNENIKTLEEAADSGADCILVLGCQVRDDGTPSNMLSDRLKKGVELYNQGAARKILMSGDHTGDYNEVAAMKQYAVDVGVMEEDVFVDHRGFSTYESLYRAKHLFGVEKVIIVTQEYHLYRALYIAEELGLEAVGVATDKIKYFGRTGRETREFLARIKDFGQMVIKPEISLADEAVPINGNDIGKQFLCSLF